MTYEPIPRWKQQLGGALIAVSSAGFTWWQWHTALNEGHYFKMASMAFPAFCVFGLGLIVFPGYKEERIARGEDIANLSGVDLLTPRWWVILVVGLLAGFGNYALLSSL